MGHLISSKCVSPLEVCKVIFNDLDMTEVDNKLVHLGIHERILYLIVSYNLNAHSERYSEMMFEDMWWM